VRKRWEKERNTPRGENQNENNYCQNHAHGPAFGGVRVSVGVGRWPRSACGLSSKQSQLRKLKRSELKNNNELPKEMKEVSQPSGPGARWKERARLTSVRNDTGSGIWNK
jgi:hypothetical protein